VNSGRGRRALAPPGGGRGAGPTPDARRTLGYAQSRDEAETLRMRYDDLIAAAGALDPVQSRGGKWVIANGETGEALQTFDSESDALAAAAAYSAIATDAARRRRDALVSLLLGTFVGLAGSWAVWNRARRTPEVIARAGIARTFQNIRLFQNMTVLDNVLTAMDRSARRGMLGASLSPRERARELLNFVGVGDRASTLAKNLPYGDQRRLEIARALATAPELLLLDEPAAGMNPAESSDLNKLIRDIRDRGITVLLIEHHMRVVMGISDRVAVLDHGTKIAEGAPDEVRRNPQVIAAYLGTEEVH
jgi:ABC-type branched-subunit amino acid transport system ATPase component